MFTRDLPYIACIVFTRVKQRAYTSKNYATVEIHLNKLKRYSQTYTIYKKKTNLRTRKETIMMIGTSYNYIERRVVS